MRVGSDSTGTRRVRQVSEPPMLGPLCRAAWIPFYALTPRSVPNHPCSPLLIVTAICSC